MSMIKKMFLSIVTALMIGCMAFTGMFLTGCDCTGGFFSGKSMFKDNLDAYVLTEDYKLGDNDVKATNGEDKVVKLSKGVSFDLGQKVLDLNGYTLSIASEAEGALVTIKNGTVKNGNLIISVPKGDIEFDKTEIADSVNYELEAASQTIRFSNVTSKGKATVKSDTHIELSYSDMADIDLAGNASLQAGEGTALGKLSVGKNATGAKVVIAPTAKVTSLAVAAKAEINIAGEVEDVAINAVAKVEVTGSIKKVSVSSEATSETETAEIVIAKTAVVDNVDIKAKTNLEVQGVVASVGVSSSASGTQVKFTGEQAVAGRVVINAENIVVKDDSGAVQKVVVSSDVVDKVELPKDVVVDVVEDATELEKAHHYVLIQDTPATCIEKGEKVYKCDGQGCEEGCEDSYTIIVPTKPHTIEETIVRLPSQIATGIKGHTCTVCGYYYESKIPALAMESEALYQLICLALGDQDMTLTIDEDSKFAVYSENSNYVDSLGYRTTVDIEVAKASLSVKNGEPKGMVQFEITGFDASFDGDGDIKTFVSENEEKHTIKFNLYINDGAIFIEMASDDEKQNTTIGLKMLEDILFGEDSPFGAEEVFKAIEIYNYSQTAFENYAPFIEAIKNSNGDVSINTEEIINILDEYVIAEEEIAGIGTKYQLDVNGIAKFTDRFATETAKDIIEEKFGEGTIDDLAEKLKEIPNKTVKDIADYAIALAEEYKFDVDYTFTLIETYVKMATDIEIDIQSELEERYDLTIIDIVMLMSGGQYGPDMGGDFEGGEIVEGGEQSDKKNEASLMSERTPIQEGIEGELGGELGGEMPPAPPITKEGIIAMFNDVVDMVVNYAETYTIDQLYNVLVYKDVEFKPEGSDKAFALSEMIKGVIAIVDEAESVSIMVDEDGNLIEIMADISGVGITYQVVEGTYTSTAYYGLYLVEVSYGVDTEKATASISVYNEENAVYESVYAVEINLAGEEYKYEILVEELDNLFAKAGLNIGSAEGKLTVEAMLSALGYDVEFDVSEEEQTGSLTIKNGENVVVQLSVEDSETGKIATAIALGYKLELDVNDTEKTAVGTLYTQNPETTEYDEFASVEIECEGEEFDFRTAVKMADQVLGEIIANWEGEEQLTWFDASASVALFGGYDLEVSADNEEKTASAILYQSLGEEKVEMGKLVVGNDEEGFTVLSVFLGQQELGKFSLKGSEINEFSSKLEVSIRDVNINYDISVEELAENKHKLSILVKIDNGIEIITELVEYTIEIAQEENVQTIKLGMFVTMNDGSVEEAVVMLDGETAFMVTSNEDSIEKVDVNVDIDRFTYMFGSDIVEGVVLNTYQEYFEGEFDVTLDFTKSEEIPEDFFADIKEDIKQIEKIDIDYNERDFESSNKAFAIEYKQAEDGNYLELKEKISDDDQHQYIKNGYTEYIALVPIVDGAYIPNGTINLEEVCKDWLDVNIQVVAPSRMIKYDLFDKVIYDSTESGEVYNHSYYLGTYYNVETGAVEEDYNDIHDCEETVKMLGKTCYDGIELTYDCKNCDYNYSNTHYDCVYEEEIQEIGETLCGPIDVVKETCVGCGDTAIYYNGSCYMDYVEYRTVAIEEIQALNINEFVADDFEDAHVRVDRCHMCGIKEYKYTIYQHNDETNECYIINHNVYKYEGQVNENTEEMDFEPFEYKTTVREKGCYSYTDTIESISGSENGDATERAKFLEYIYLVFGEDFVKDNKIDFWSGSAISYGCDRCKTVRRIDLRALTYYGQDAYPGQNVTTELYFAEGEFDYAYIDSYDHSTYDWDSRLFKMIAEPYLEYVNDNIKNRIVGVIPSGYIYADGTKDLSIEFILKAQTINGQNYNDIVNVEIYENGKFGNDYGYAKVGYYDVATCEVDWYVYDKAGTFVGSSTNERHSHTEHFVSETSCCTEEGYVETDKCVICEKVLYDNTYTWHMGAEIDCGELNGEQQEVGFASAPINIYAWYYGYRCWHCDKLMSLNITLHGDWILTDNVYLYAEGFNLDLNGYTIDLAGYNLIIYSINGDEIYITDNFQNEESEGGKIIDSVGGGYLVAFTDNTYSQIDVTFITIECDSMYSDTDSRDTIAQSFLDAKGEVLEGYQSNFR